MQNKKILIKILFATLLFSETISNAQQWGDYTLYSAMSGTTAVLLDTNRNTFHTWTFASTAKTGYSTYMLPGGSIVRTVARTGNSFTGGPICGEVQKVDYNGNVLWDYVYSTTNYCTHHDICPMPNGNVLLIAYERKASSEVTAAGCTSFSSESWPEKIVEVQPTGATTGTVVWEWHAWDHLVQSTNSSLANFQSSVVNHPELINVNLMTQKDWIHMNGVDYNPMLDQVTFTCHNLNEIYVIDHSTTSAEAASHSGGNSGKGGDILFRWGKPSNYGATGTSIINVCHDAHWIKEGLPHETELAYYNNSGNTGGTSCGDIFLPPLVGYNYSINLGSAYLPSTYTKRQVSGGTNTNMGNIQELPNGNILINMGVSRLIKEFNPTGNLLWTYTVSASNAKAFKYDNCYLNNAAPAIPTVSQSGNDLVSTAATTYQWYMNGQKIIGATSQTYTPSQNGIYVVRITDSNGCVYEYSSGFHFSIATSIYENNIVNGIILYPNPSTGIVNFDVKELNGETYEIKIIDAVGRIVVIEKNAVLIDLSGYANGLYFIKISSANFGSTTKKIAIQK